MLDREGYRPNVGIILCNAKNEVFWGKRIKEHSWQFPQGGIKRGETPEAAMYRELHEEVGLRPEHVRILGRTRDWLRYDVPMQWIKREWRGSYKGQKQIWFLLRLVGRDSDVSLRATDHPGGPVGAAGGGGDLRRHGGHRAGAGAVDRVARLVALTGLRGPRPRRGGKGRGCHRWTRPRRNEATRGSETKKG